MSESVTAQLLIYREFSTCLDAIYSPGTLKTSSGDFLRLREAGDKSLDCVANVFEAFKCLAIALYSFEEHVEGSNPETVFAI